MLFPAGYFPTGYFPPAYFGGISAMPQVVLDVIVGYAPDPLHAALTLTEGGTVFGPFPASGAANGDGTYTLTAALSTLPAGLVPGAVSIQPGDLAGGVFTAIGPAILGTLKLDADAPPDLSLSAGPALVSLSPPEPRLLAAAAGFVHVRMSAANAADGSPVDLTLMPVSLAVTTGSPQTGDYEAGDWLTVTAPDAPAGTYARLAVGPNTLTAGVYFVDVMTAGLTVRADGILLVN